MLSFLVSAFGATACLLVGLVSYYVRHGNEPQELSTECNNTRSWAKYPSVSLSLLISAFEKPSGSLEYPSSREGAVAVTLGFGDELLLFSGLPIRQLPGTGGAPLNDLWRYDMSGWKEVVSYGVLSDGPPPIRAHALGLPLSDSRLLVFGGHEKLSSVLNDAWVFTNQDSTWSLLSCRRSKKPKKAVDIFDQTNFRDHSRECIGSRHNSAFAKISSDSFLVYGGSGCGDEVCYGLTSGLWRADVAVRPSNSDSQGSIRWQRLSGDGRVNVRPSCSVNSSSSPGGRVGAVAWVSESDGGEGKEFFLFGGEFDDGGRRCAVNDVWVFDIAHRSWTFRSGSTRCSWVPMVRNSGECDAPAKRLRQGKSMYPSARISPGIFHVNGNLDKFPCLEDAQTSDGGDQIVIFGGRGVDCFGLLHMGDFPLPGAWIWSDRGVLDEYVWNFCGSEKVTDIQVGSLSFSGFSEFLLRHSNLVVVEGSSSLLFLEFGSEDIPVVWNVTQVVPSLMDGIQRQRCLAKIEEQRKTNLGSEPEVLTEPPTIESVPTTESEEQMVETDLMTEYEPIREERDTADLIEFTEAVPTEPEEAEAIVDGTSEVLEVIPEIPPTEAEPTTGPDQPTQVNHSTVEDSAVPTAELTETSASKVVPLILAGLVILLLMWVCPEVQNETVEENLGESDGEEDDTSEEIVGESDVDIGEIRQEIEPRNDERRLNQSSPSVAVAVFDLRCRYARDCHAFVVDLGLGDHWFNHTHSRCFCDDCRPSHDLKSCAGRRYTNPVGWVKMGIPVPPHLFSGEKNIFRDWCVAYHGTRPDSVVSIIDIGLLRPGLWDADGRPVSIRPDHIDYKRLYPKDEARLDPEKQRKREILKKFTQSRFVSPSLEYASRYSGVRAFRGRRFRMVFQVRIRPDSFLDELPFDGGQKHTLRRFFDRLFPDECLEWFTPNEGVIVLTGLLVQVLD